MNVRSEDACHFQECCVVNRYDRLKTESITIITENVAIILLFVGPKNQSPCFRRYDFEIALKLNSPSLCLSTIPSLISPLTPFPSARWSRSSTLVPGSLSLTYPCTGICLSLWPVIDEYNMHEYLRLVFIVERVILVTQKVKTLPLSVLDLRFLQTGSGPRLYDH